MTNLDLAQLFTNTFPNTLDTTIASTACLSLTEQDCHPLSYVITGDINAMWLRDSAYQLMPYLDYIKHDVNLKQLFLGAIYMQAQFINMDPYSNAFKEPNSMEALARHIRNPPLTPSLGRREVKLKNGGKLPLLYQCNLF
jgi:meiotically up-regulated gene 157 (Mug157) protein